MVTSVRRRIAGPARGARHRSVEGELRILAEGNEPDQLDVGRGTRDRIDSGIGGVVDRPAVHAGRHQGEGDTPGAQLVRDGRLVALGVTTAQRIPPLPDIPTIAEQGFPGYELNEWNGLYAPARTPAPVVQRLFEASRAALADETVKQRLEALGAIPVGTDPATFAAYVAAQRAAMAEIVRSAKIEAG